MVIGLIVIFMTIIFVAKDWTDSNAKLKIRGVSMLFLFIGVLFMLLLVYSIWLAFFGIAMIILGVEFLIISGRVRSY
jgi:hypothetical protein